jgi:hypothetical protein
MHPDSVELHLLPRPIPTTDTAFPAKQARSLWMRRTGLLVSAPFLLCLPDSVRTNLQAVIHNRCKHGATGFSATNPRKKTSPKPLDFPRRHAYNGTSVPAQTTIYSTM